MSMAEAGRTIVERSPKDDAHSWARNVDRRTTRPRGRIIYGYHCVQEIVSGTPHSVSASASTVVSRLSNKEPAIATRASGGSFNAEPLAVSSRRNP